MDCWPRKVSTHNLNLELGTKKKKREEFEDDPAKILGILKSEPIYHAHFKTNTRREKSPKRSTNQQNHKTGSLDKGSARVGRNCVNSALSLFRYLSLEVIHCESRRFFKESYKPQSQMILADVTIKSQDVAADAFQSCNSDSLLRL